MIENILPLLLIGYYLFCCIGFGGMLHYWLGVKGLKLGITTAIWPVTLVVISMGFIAIFLGPETDQHSL